jgi:Extensin-like protein C-terminus
LVAAVALFAARDTWAGPNLAHFPAGALRLPACRYARLAPRTCLSDLARRGIGFTRVVNAPGVLIPVRLTGKLGGVLYRTDFPNAERKHLPWEVFDCRLVLALDDFSRILLAHGIDEAHIFSAWRPPPKSWPAGKIGRRHPGALAVDVRLFKKKNGDELDIQRDFHGRIGRKTCGEGAPAPSPPTPEARELHSIACEAADAHLFNVILTPDFNKAHHNHFHLEVTAAVKWFIVR